MGNKTRKVILVLVEGTTDATTLIPLKDYIRETNLGFDDSFIIAFKPVKDRDIIYNRKLNKGEEYGDVFTRKKFADLPKEERLLAIEKEIVGNVEDYLTENKFSCQDIAQIIQLTDMDGAYIPDEWIKKMTPEEMTIEGIKIFYYDKCIHARIAEKDPRKPIKLHQNKRDAIDYFVNTSKLLVGCRSIPYKLFFMSCNLEHFYHDERNCLNKKAKGDLAKSVIESYSENVMKYAEFIKKHRIPELQTIGLPWTAVHGQSWYIIRKKNTNYSLSRCSNIFLIENLCKELTEKTIKERSK